MLFSAVTHISTGQIPLRRGSASKAISPWKVKASFVGKERGMRSMRVVGGGRGGDEGCDGREREREGTDEEDR